jgi:enamine deaminase RidA (YjgF/YER057c/UK114 family)
MIQKVLRYAEKIGMDKEELLDLTVLEAMTKIEEMNKMWTKYAEEVKK